MDGWIHAVVPGDIRSYDNPAVDQGEIVVGDSVVLGLGQVDEITRLASLAMPFLGVTVAV